MDENKDFLENEESLENEAILENGEGLAESLGENTSEQLNADFMEEDKNKKSFPIQTPIIISFVIVLVFISIFATCKIFLNNSIIGTWVLDSSEVENEATPDEAGYVPLTYYTFDKNNILTISKGTVKNVYSYQYIKQDDGTYYVYTDILYGDVKITGNLITGRQMSLSSESFSVKFNSAKLKLPKLKLPDDYSVGDKLVGVWSMPEYLISYDLKADGTFTYSQSDSVFFSGNYTYTDDEIKFIYYADSQDEISIEYALDEKNNVLIMNGLGYYKTNEDGSLVSTPDEYK